jgi:hypothetical protein
MPEIGETLRETRMRRRIDMSDVEAATKIRAKYLRALENEEWDLLPGPTFVKTFLRTYAEYLELDPRLLVEEYRQRYERPATQDLAPFSPGLGGQRRQRRRPRLPLGPGLVIVAGVLILLAAFYGLGRWGQGDEPAGAPNQVDAAPTPTATATPRATAPRARPTRVTLRLTAVDPVYVCLEDASGRVVVAGATLQPGQSTRTFRSRRFRANFGNGGIRMRVNGRSYRATSSSDPLGYDLRPGRRPRRLAESVRRGLCT